MIQPTVGRIVHYYDDRDSAYQLGDSECAAIITYVHAEDLVNLTVFGANGETHSRTSVRLVQPTREPEGAYCSWMPYQVKKAHGSESGEPAVGKEEV